MENGKIIKGIAGFYYVYVEACEKQECLVSSCIYECKAKGVFRNRKIKPPVGDNVIIEVVDKDKCTGNIIDILPRNNELIRPAAANIDQALIIFAIANPMPNYNLLDRFLVMMEYQEIPTIICFNKIDLVDKKYREHIKLQYKKCGCKVIFTSTSLNEGLEQLKQLLENKTTILAGPSGVGKSTITNKLYNKDVMEIGNISKIGRGRHTTRHSEIFNVSEATYICDTPGFTSFNLPIIEKEQLRFYYSEFEEYEGFCKYNGCVHINEPDCAVKKAVDKGILSKERYNVYVSLYQELMSQKKY